jgi:hypothetical protein
VSPYTVGVVRRWFTERSTVGELLVPGITVALFVLEDPVREGPKISGETAIPPGDYRMTLYQSPKFGRLVLLLHGVPGFSSIEFHPGNAPTDTRGCILPGMGRAQDRVVGSRIAMDLLMARCEWEASRGRELRALIENGQATT